MNGLEITDVKVKKVENKDSKFVGVASIVLNNCFAIHNIRIIDMKGDKGLFISMPSQKLNNSYFDLCHPINQETRKYFENVILAEYFHISSGE